MDPTKRTLKTSTSNSAMDSQPDNEQSLRCYYCYYVPTGNEKWKASNLTRHIKSLHPGKGYWKSGGVMSGDTETTTLEDENRPFGNVTDTVFQSRQEPSSREYPSRKPKGQRHTVDSGNPYREDGEIKPTTKRKYDDAFAGETGEAEGSPDKYEDSTDTGEEDDGSGINGHPAFAQRSQLASERLPPYAINPRYWGRWVDYGIPEWAVTGGRFPAESKPH